LDRVLKTRHGFSPTFCFVFSGKQLLIARNNIHTEKVYKKESVGMEENADGEHRLQTYGLKKLRGN